MTQRYSGNGWPAYPDTSHFTRFTAAGQGWWAANADVAVVFKEFIERFSREVEPLAGKVLDEWSYANRLVRGSATVVSNHGSATAIDLNAVKHPRGVANTFSPGQRQKMREIKNSITDGHGVTVLRLGMDFDTVVDDMHVEIHANPQRVKQAADQIRTRNRQHQEISMPLNPEDLKNIGDEVWGHARKLAPTHPQDKPQTPGGLLHTIAARVGEVNLEAQVSDGITRALENPTHPLSLALSEIKTALNRVLTQLPVDPAP